MGLRIVLYVICLALGPTLLVDGILKDNHYSIWVSGFIIAAGLTMYLFTDRKG